MIGRSVFRRLSVQLVALLTVALFPLGAIAIFQTNKVAYDAERNFETSILGLTERAARTEQSIIERAVGASQFLSSIAVDLIDDPADCRIVLEQFVSTNPEVSYAAVVGQSGMTLCVSSGQPRDLSATTTHRIAMTTERPTITVDDEDVFAGTPSFIVADPFERSDEAGGYVIAVVPHLPVAETSDPFAALGLIELVTFNAKGEVLTARSDRASVMQELPVGVSLADLPLDRPTAFRGRNADDAPRYYSVVTIEGAPASVMAVWDRGTGLLPETGSRLLAMSFPALMWIASVAVAMLAMNSLVLRHLRRIRRNMDRFSDARHIPDDDAGHQWTPLEIDALEANFARMASEIVNDEAKLEDGLREKAVLVKEIHHRVKNNLQLISSIMNMKIRSAKAHETKIALQSIQQRVLSLTTIHRDLYQTRGAGRVEAGVLLEEIIERSTELVETGRGRVKIASDIAPVTLYPDQAVPLSLFVAEATTNALKYMGDPQAGDARLEVSLTQAGDDCVLTISNTIGDQARGESTGMGAKLMNAFAHQLGGTYDVDHADGLYRVRLAFEIREFDLEDQDY